MVFWSKWTRRSNSLVMAGMLCLSLTGCQTLFKEPEHQFTPVQHPPQVAVEEVEAPPPPSAADLLRAAGDAFRAANEFQEKGDHEASLRQYKLMLELLIEADLDPTIFYNLRGEFGKILETTSQQASLFQVRQPRASEPTEQPTLEAASELQIEFPLHERVLAELESIQRGYAKNFQAGLQRSGKYMPQIRERFEKAGLPKELVWLGMVESQFSPYVTSPAGAGGMWQFMRFTGLRYGLRVDAYVDERYCWDRATDAAIQYLKDLNAMFDGSWPLAVCAYNMGEGGLERVLAQAGGERDFWALLDTPAAANYLPLETKKYYPRLIASIIVATNPERYGFTPSTEPVEKTTKTQVKGMYSLATLNDALGLGKGTLERLNPHLTRKVTPPTGEATLYVPEGVGGQVATALSQIGQMKPEPVATKITYVIKKGDTLGKIADQYGVTEEAIRRANRLRSGRSLTPGKKLIVPGVRPESSETQGSGPDAKSAPAPEAKVYTVKKGDTLSDIASANKVSIGDIAKWNNLGKNAVLKAGDKLKLGPGGASAPTAKASGGEEKTHSVEAGDYPAKIARQYGIPLDDLLKWNDLNSTSTLQIGQKLTLQAPQAATPAPAQPEKTGKKSGAAKPASAGASGGDQIEHTVAKGENPSTIARKYGVTATELSKWNNWKKVPVLDIGDKVIVIKKK